jgi:Protein of unknown function (DUF3341)
MNTSSPVRAYAIGAEFDSAASVYEAAQKVRDQGYVWWDVHSPMPIHGIDQARGSKKSWVSAFAATLGIIGLITAVSLQVLTSVPRPELLAGVKQGWFLDLFYPIVVSGKPYFSMTGGLPVIVVLTVQLTGYGAFIGMLLFNFLPRLHNPLFNWNRFCDKASNDGFFLTIEAADPKYSEAKTHQLLAELGGQHITVIPQEGSV